MGMLKDGMVAQWAGQPKGAWFNSQSRQATCQGVLVWGINKVSIIIICVLVH